LNAKTDVEMGVSPDENRCLITDMLGLRPSFKTPELLVSSFTSSELNKIAQKEEFLNLELCRSRDSSINKIVSDTLDEILKTWLVSFV
jgi:hypothetical protein